MIYIEQTNEPSPADGDAKLEQQVSTNYDKIYEEMITKEQQALESKIQGEATQNFDRIRTLGFATKKDVEENIKGIFGKFVNEMEAMRQENAKLREWVMRAKMQGLNSGATDDKPKDNNLLKSHERFKW